MNPPGTGGMNSTLPAFGICGWSGSGKTTLLVEVVRHFTTRGLRVAVIKDDVHGPDIDCGGKDSDRLFRAGADVVLTGPAGSFARAHLVGSEPLQARVARLDFDHDLVLVEGHKSAHLARKVWLLKEAAETCPLNVSETQRVLAPGEDRVAVVTAMVEEWLIDRQAASPLCAGILFGGRSRRMGRPKHLLPLGNATWLEHIVAVVQAVLPHVVLLGAGDVPPGLRALPVLPDAPAGEGPLAGMLTAMRWRPDAAWVFVACDQPRISPSAVEWLLRQRAPGVSAILPRLPDARGVEPLFALYEFRARALLENCLAPSDLAGKPGVITPEPPPALAEAWANMNAPADVGRPRRPLIPPS
jgi:molybdopterin-guanine dinucleotide biosynthesis protein MobB